MNKHTLLTVAILLFACSSILFAQDGAAIAKKQFELQVFDRAAKSYKKLLDDPKLDLESKKEASARIGDCYYYTNDLQQAKIWYAKALSIGAGEAGILLKYGHTLRALGEYDEAVGVYSKYEAKEKGVGAHFASVTASVQKIKNTKSKGTVVRHPNSSNGMDFGPTSYNDKLIFSSSRADKVRSKINRKSSNDWEAQSANELYETNKPDSYGTLKHLRSDLRNERNEGPLAYSPDGKKVVFTKNSFIKGNRAIIVPGEKMSLYVADVKDNGDWEDAKPFMHNGLSYSTGFPYFSEDGAYLYFISNRPDGFGGFDIYRCTYQNGKMGQPSNLGYPINTAGNEISPSIDNGTLYFASDWHHGIGGFDIFSAKVGPSYFTDVMNLGSGVNSPYDDYSYTKITDSKYAFVSNRNTNTLEDIFINKKEAPSFAIQVLDENKKPITNATVDLKNCGLGTMKTNAQGMVTVKNIDENCSLAASATNYKGFQGKTTFANGTATITLAKSERMELEGIVRDEKGAPMESVTVVASGGEINVASSTDVNGKYKFNLKKDFTYNLKFAKEGFETQTNSFKTSTGVLSLPSINLKPLAVVEPVTTELAVVEKVRDVEVEEPIIEKVSAAKAPEVVETAVPATASSAPTVKTTVETKVVEPAKVVKEEVVVETRTVEETTTKVEEAEPVYASVTTTNSTSNSQISKGTQSFVKGTFIQLGAYTSEVDKSKYAALESLGDIMVQNMNGLNKVYLGVFESKAEAATVLKKVKALDFDGYVKNLEIPTNVSPSRSLAKAPIIEEPVVKETVKTTEVVTIEKPVAVAETVAMVAKTVSEKTTETAASKNIMVRLAAYKSPQWFKADDFQNIAPIYKQEKGDWTIFYLEGFNSVQEAEAAKLKANKLGFNTAYIVEKQGNDFNRL